MKSINYALLFIACVLFHLAGTWGVPLIDRDEPRFAETSREMIQRADYVVPYFNNHFRFDKPPLVYWAQVASYRIFGQNDFAARFPSAVAASLVALVILAWGTRLPTTTASPREIDRSRVGWWAAVIFTLSLQVFVHAKAAVADMWLVLFMTLAHWAGYELLGDRLTIDDGKRSTLNAQHPTPNSEALGWWTMYYLSLAFGFLAKGPIAWTPLLTFVPVKWLYRDIKLASRFKFVRGILLMLAVVALWGVPALVRTHGEFFRIGIGRHVLGRSFGAMEGHGGNSLGVYLLLLPFYFVAIFLSFFPWSIKLPSLIKRLRQGRDQTDSYLLAGGAIIFVIFSVIKTKLPHYTLPAFPLLSLLIARHLVNRQQFLRRWAIASACVYLVIAAIVPSLISGSLMVLPIITGSSPAHDLFELSRDHLRPEMEFGAVNFQEPSLVWYFRSRVNGWMTPLNSITAAQFMEKDGPRFVILPSALVTVAFPALQPGWTTCSIDGFDIPKGKQVDLTLVLKPD